jgi:hypothetical protein
MKNITKPRPLDWTKSGAYQAWADTDIGSYYIWHAIDGRYACEFLSIESGKLIGAKQDIIGRYGTVEAAKAGSEEHYADKLKQQRRSH